MNVMRRLKSIASGRTSISSEPVSMRSFYFIFLIAGFRFDLIGILLQVKKLGVLIIDL